MHKLHPITCQAGRIKTAETSNLAQDFIAGMDPLGTWTSGYGMQAERENLSEAEHTLKKLVGTTGGVIGGGVLVPSAGYGAMNALKGFAGGKGGLKGRLANAARKGWGGFKSPAQGIAGAIKARNAAQRVADEGGKFTSDELENLVNVSRGISLGSVYDGMPGFQGKLTGILNAAPERGRDIPGAAARGLLGSIKNRFTGETAGSIGNPIQKARGAASAVKQLGNLDQQTLARNMVDPLNTSVRSALGSLSVGAGVGGIGAYAQYEKGRQMERDTTVGARIRRGLGFG